MIVKLETKPDAICDYVKMSIELDVDNYSQAFEFLKALDSARQKYGKSDVSFNVSSNPFGVDDD